jgi:Protein of unknown function (DUF3102)
MLLSTRPTPARTGRSLHIPYFADSAAADQNAAKGKVTKVQTQLIGGESSPGLAIANPILDDHAAEIRRLGRRLIADIVEIGRRLTECKAIVGHGNWLPWLEQEFGWTDDTALNFMRAHELSKSRKFRDLSLPVSSIYLLAAPSTPESARDEIFDRAEAGENLSVTEVKRTIEGAKRGMVFVTAAGHAERGVDLYQTPAAAVHALLEVEPLSGTIWEPACGPGAIVRVLRDAGYRVAATDLIDYGCPDARGGVDFLTQTEPPEGAMTILTNPPFMHADEFVRRALSLCPRVIMLQRLTFLESERRCDILDGGDLARVYVFRNRLPMIHRDGWDGPRIDSSAMAMAWFVWQRGHQGPATIDRITASDDA